MAKFAHNSKAPRFTRKYMYYCTNHTPPPFSHLAVQKKFQIYRIIQPGLFFHLLFFFFKENTNPHHEMQRKPKSIEKASQCVGKVGGIYLSSHELMLLQCTNKYEPQWETMNISPMSLFIHATWALKYTFKVFSPSALLVWSVANALKPKKVCTHLIGLCFLNTAE